MVDPKVLISHQATVVNPKVTVDHKVLIGHRATMGLWVPMDRHPFPQAVLR